ncbi:MAG: hypothetical protein F4050_07295, partial [Rhodospirillaceae bacterium]|nr:hypothetical protein [Rhodospirillaceae bacterium]
MADSTDKKVYAYAGDEVSDSPYLDNDLRPGNRYYVVGTAIDTLNLPTASGGGGTLTYSLTPSVPGLTFDSATRRLSGTPSATGTHDMTYT